MSSPADVEMLARRLLTSTGVLGPCTAFLSDPLQVTDTQFYDMQWRTWCITFGSDTVEPALCSTDLSGSSTSVLLSGNRSCSCNCAATGQVSVVLLLYICTAARGTHPPQHKYRHQLSFVCPHSCDIEQLRRRQRGLLRVIKRVQYGLHDGSRCKVLHEKAGSW